MAACIVFHTLCLLAGRIWRASWGTLWRSKVPIAALSCVTSQKSQVITAKSTTREKKEKEKQNVCGMTQCSM